MFELFVVFSDDYNDYVECADHEALNAYCAFAKRNGWLILRVRALVPA